MAAPARHAHLDSYLGKSYNVSGTVVFVHKIIAEGGYGIVFLAKSTSNFNEPGAKCWALKRVLVNNQEDLRNCQREIFVMRTNRSNPNVVRLEQSAINSQGGDIHEVLMLMEFCTSGNLLELMNQHFSEGRKLPEPQVLRIFYDVVKAIASLHQSETPVIHRDLKVENVLIQGDLYKLCDFGSCTRTTVTPSLENVHGIEEDLQRFTTLSYRSPEMVDLYSNKTIGTKSDIWALGVMLYKMCFFTLAFGESMVAIMEGNFKLPENSPYSRSLHSLICYLLTVDADERPDIFQVAYVVSNMTQLPLTVKNSFNSPIPTHLPDPPPLGQKRHERKQSLQAQNAQTVTQTSLTPRQRPKANPGGSGNAPSSTAAAHVPSAAAAPATAPAAVDAFGASTFAPATAAVATTAGAPLQSAAAPGAMRHRRVPVGSVRSKSTGPPSSSTSSQSAAAVDAFGAPAFGIAPVPAAAPSSAASQSAAGAQPVSATRSRRSKSPSVGSVMSSDSFDPRGGADDRMDAPCNPTVSIAEEAAVDPFGAAVFAPPTHSAPPSVSMASGSRDMFDLTPFGEQAPAAPSVVSQPSSPRATSPIPHAAVAINVPATAPARAATNSDPFNMSSFSSSLDSGSGSGSAAGGMPPPQQQHQHQAVDAFGAPVFQTNTRAVTGHRRVSSDVTGVLFHSDPFDAAPFNPAPQPATSNVNSFASGAIGSSSTAGARSDNGLMGFGGSQNTHTLPAFSQHQQLHPRTAPSSPIPPVGGGVAFPGIVNTANSTAADMSWTAKQQELLRQKEKLEERQRALLLQQQELARQQTQLAHMQCRVGTPTPPGQMNGQVFANPMAQQGRSPQPVIKFAHASSLSPSGAALTGAAIQQQQQHKQMHNASSPVFHRRQSPTFPLHGPTGPPLGDVFR
eukprot:scpid75667/ scgid32691/ AP2-associated protein kinase 1; Adaptor-associated kinase 1